MIILVRRIFGFLERVVPSIRREKIPSALFVRYSQAAGEVSREPRIGTKAPKEWRVFVGYQAVLGTLGGQTMLHYVSGMSMTCEIFGRGERERGSPNNLCIFFKVLCENKKSRQIVSKINMINWLCYYAFSGSEEGKKI
jgi:hypothetical protein